MSVFVNKVRSLKECIAECVHALQEMGNEGNNNPL
jgi:hypothetical protein